MIKHVTNGVSIDIQLPSDDLGCLVSSAMEFALKRNSWEQCEHSRVKQYLPDTDVIEFGAGIGYISCIIDKKLTNKKHLVIEANPYLIPILEHHKEINDASFTVIHKAYDPLRDPIRFSVKSAHEGIVGKPHEVIFDVQTTSIAKLIAEYDIDNYALVMDIEGAEVGLVADSGLNKCQMVIIEIHPPLCKIDVDSFLKSIGFTLVNRCRCPINWVGVYER
jgi:FkbM family methyltransferase